MRSRRSRTTSTDAYISAWWWALVGAAKVAALTAFGFLDLMNCRTSLSRVTCANKWRSKWKKAKIHMSSALPLRNQQSADATDWHFGVIWWQEGFTHGTGYSCFFVKHHQNKSKIVLAHLETGNWEITQPPCLRTKVPTHTLSRTWTVMFFAEQFQVTKMFFRVVFFLSFFASISFH